WSASPPHPTTPPGSSSSGRRTTRTPATTSTSPADPTGGLEPEVDADQAPEEDDEPGVGEPAQPAGGAADLHELPEDEAGLHTGDGEHGHGGEATGGGVAVAPEVGEGPAEQGQARQDDPHVGHPGLGGYASSHVHRIR